MKLCNLIFCSYRRTVAKYCLIILKYDKSYVISNVTAPQF